MSTDLFARIVTAEIWAFVLGLLGIVVYQMLTGKINVYGLLTVKDPAAGAGGPGDAPPAAGAPPRTLSPTRVQLLVLTVAGAFTYLSLVAEADPGTLPEVPPELLLVFGGSASIYLGGKSLGLVLRELMGAAVSSSDRHGDR